jgi:hypothetical protein
MAAYKDVKKDGEVISGIRYVSRLCHFNFKGLKYSSPLLKKYISKDVFIVVNQVFQDRVMVYDKDTKELICEINPVKIT